MTIRLERTSWRGIRVDHPAHWELAWASGPDEPGRLTFADRYYHRLEVRWRPLRFVPNLDMLLDKYRRKEKDDATEILELTSPPQP